MTDQQRSCITRLRLAGKSYGTIANELGLSANTVKSYCQRQGIQPAQNSGNSPIPYICQQCGRAITQPVHRKLKRFCSDKCRSRWWNAHRMEMSHKTTVITPCAYCSNPFESYPQEHRKYCSHACYIHARFRGDRP